MELFYQRKLEEYIADTLQVRLNWLLSGSRVPFGVITEQRSENNGTITSLRPQSSSLSRVLSVSSLSLSVSLSTRVLVALDCSQLVLTQTLVLQQHLRTLLEQQLSHVRVFNLLR